VILSQIHEFDYLYWFFGLPRRVFTIGGHYSSLDINVEDVASTVMEFNPAGRPVAVHIHQDYVQRPPARGVMILGDAGKVVVDFRALSLTRYDDSGALAEHHDFNGLQRNQLFLDEMAYFLACLRGEVEPLVTIEDGVQSLRMALAARQSLETSQVVELAR
jgi:predicted dehydrogenase